MESGSIVIKRMMVPGNGFIVPCVLLIPSKPVGAAVIVHGYGGCKEEQLGLAWRVAESGLVTCAIDLRGHGEHQLSLDEHIQQDVEAAVDYCRQYGKVAAIGHSLGGRLALLSDADHSIAISPAFGQTFHPKTEETVKSLRAHRVRESPPWQIFDVLRALPVWQDGNGKQALVIYASRDIPDIMGSCMELKSKGVPVVEIDMATHGDIFLNEATFEKVTGQLAEWFSVT